MKTAFLKILLVTLCFVMVIPVFSQPVLVREGEYQYVVPSDQSVDEAKRVALQRAQLKILADEFGTAVSQTSSTITKNSSEESSVDFSSIGITDVRGVWIETVGEPKYTVNAESDFLTITVRVKGKIRELKRNTIDFVAKVLRDGTSPSNEADSFRDGNSMYLSFSSPSSGYLAVYLQDAESRVYCLLPYVSDTDGEVPVKANKNYLFFSEKDALPLYKPEDVDEYMLTCAEKTETNYIYIVFSPNAFSKAADNEGRMENGNVLPRELSNEDFVKWLSRIRTRDDALQVDIRTITVNK